MPKHIRFDDDGRPLYEAKKDQKKRRQPLRQPLEEETQEEEEQQLPAEEPACQFVMRQTRLVVGSKETALVIWYPHDGSKTYQLRVDCGPKNEDCEYLSFPGMKRKTQIRMIHHLLRCMFCNEDVISSSLERYNETVQENGFRVYQEEMFFRDLPFRQLYADLKMLRRLI